jgi:hypothetical protein
MNEPISNEGLPKYDKFILNRIISGFTADKEFNVYELVRDAVSYKCIIPSQNELIMETFFNIKEFLVINEFVVELKEMSAYVLTGKGIELVACGSLEKYEENKSRKNKRSIIHSFFFGNKHEQKTPGTNMLAFDYYE